MSDTVPAEVVTTLLVSGVATRPMRFWAHESVRFTLQFRDGPRGALIDVDAAEISVVFRPPGGAEQIIPQDYVQRLSTGIYTFAAVPALPGPWKVFARCTTPSSTVAVRIFRVAPIPAGAVPPPTTLITDASKLFLLLSRDGSFISA
ncbi:hypothetical protein SAMN02745194_02280 [Roseomonas rosea]|uniref:Uncharacterized protein n=1 Tax=Muricoccus roseus TaxID=198092 RepID=A0A1M6I9T4_9PROT|nr:hypothetical protein [Roseomonas rosea]SHJ31197.1 hypothetical protein SAMN02745194_02280 [Roseomonas rosea]